MIPEISSSIIKQVSRSGSPDISQRGESILSQPPADQFESTREPKKLFRMRSKLMSFKSWISKSFESTKLSQKLKSAKTKMEKTSESHVAGKSAPEPDMNVMPDPSALNLEPKSEANPTEISQLARDVLTKWKRLSPDLSAPEVDRILAQFPAKQRPDALQAMERLTQYARIDRLNDLHQELSNYKICSAGEGTLASTLHYLHQKHWGENSPVSNASGFMGNSIFACKQDGAYKPNLEDLKTALESMFNKPKAILLDQNTLYRLQHEPELRKLVQEQKITLLYPDGWLEGINPFSRMDATALHEKTKALLDAARQQKKHGFFSQRAKPRHLSELASFKLQHEIDTLGLTPHLKIIRREAAAKENLSSSAIAAAVAPNLPTETQLLNEMNKFKSTKEFQADDLQKAFLQLLRDNALIYTPAKLSQLHARQHEALLAYAREQQVKPENIYFYIPQEGRSYGLTTMQYQLNNDIHPRNIITDQQEASRHLENKHERVVIVDDAAISGNSLLGETDRFSDKTVEQQNRLILAPLLSTKHAEASLERIKTSKWFPRHIGKYLSAETLLAPHSEPSSTLAEVLGQNKGWARNYSGESNFLTWYMASDTNTLVYNTAIAPHVTLNGCGVKIGVAGNKPYVYPHERKKQD